MRIVELDNENQGIGATSNCGSHEDAMQFLLMYHDAFHSKIVINLGRALVSARNWTVLIFKTGIEI